MSPTLTVLLSVTITSFNSTFPVFFTVIVYSIISPALTFVFPSTIGFPFTAVDVFSISSFGVSSTGVVTSSSSETSSGVSSGITGTDVPVTTA